MLRVVRKLLLRYWTAQAVHAMASNRQRAIRYFDRALALDPKNFELLSMRGQAKGAIDGASDHAAALALDPNNPKIHVRRAIALHRDAETLFLIREIGAGERRDLMEDAAARCSAALDLDPFDRQARSLRASSRMGLDDLDGALDDMLDLVNQCPDDALYVRRVGDIHARRGEFAEAITVLTRALSLDGDCQGAHATRAYCHFKLGNRKAARGDVDAAIARNPHDDLAHDVWGALDDGDDPSAVEVP